MKKSWQNTVFLYIYQVVGVYGWELPKVMRNKATPISICWVFFSVWLITASFIGLIFKIYSSTLFLIRIL